MMFVWVRRIVNDRGRMYRSPKLGRIRPGAVEVRSRRPLQLELTHVDNHTIAVDCDQMHIFSHATS